MDLAFAGLLLLAATVALYGLARSNRHLARSATATELMTVAELNTLHQLVSGEVGVGLFAHRAAVQGTLECEQPLISDLGQTRCAAFRYRVEHRWHEDYQDTDSHDKPVRRTRTGSDVVASNERRVPFRVRDSTGSIEVVPDGARLEMETTVERFEPGPHDGIVRFRSFEWRSHGLLPGGHRRTLGYHFHEEALPLGRTVFVLGLATDRHGSLTVGGLPDAEGVFVVSLKARDQLVHAARQAEQLARWAAAACAVLGVLLLIAAIIVQRSGLA